MLNARPQFCENWRHLPIFDGGCRADALFLRRIVPKLAEDGVAGEYE